MIKAPKRTEINNGTKLERYSMYSPEDNLTGIQRYLRSIGIKGFLVAKDGDTVVMRVPREYIKKNREIMEG